MNYKDLEKLLTILKDIPDSDKRDEGVRLMLQTASDSITYESLKSLLEKEDSEKAKQEQDSNKILLKLPKKEISKIPMRFRKELRINDYIVRCRRRQSGKKTVNYEIRYRKHGLNIAVLLDGLEGSRYQTLMAVALYTGLRPNEYKTAKIDGDFIVAINSKRKSGKVEYKKIPISKMLNGIWTELINLIFRERNICATTSIKFCRTIFYTIYGRPFTRGAKNVELRRLHEMSL